MKNLNKLDSYLEESHNLALKQLKEKMSLELKYDNNITLEKLINIIHDNELFTMKEYTDIYNEIKTIIVNK